MQLVFVHYFIILVYAINMVQQADKVYELDVNNANVMDNSSCQSINRTTRREPVNVEPMRRIVGGSPVLVVDYPFSVMLIHAHGLTVHCGASLITRKWILSAAHCCFNKDNRRYHPRELLAIPSISAVQYVDLEVIVILKTFPHEKYDVWTMSNDIALMLLSNPVKCQLAELVQLATTSEYLDFYAKKPEIAALGWGTMAKKRSAFYQYLVISNFRQVILPTIDLMDCRSRIGHRVTQRNICTLYPSGGRDTCQGDSGGPLMWGNLQVGIVSWGIGCALRGNPGVNTRVDYYTKWIDNVMNQTIESATSTCYSNIYIIITSVLFTINKCISICVS